MRMLCISNLWPPHVVGGAELIAASLAEELARRGHEVASVSIGPEGSSPSETLRGVSVHRITPDNGLWCFQGRKCSRPAKALWHIRDAWNPQVALRLREIISEFEPEIVHTHNIDGMSPIVWAVAEEAKLPIVHTAHDFHLLCPKTTLLRRDARICARTPLPCRLYRWWYRAQGQVVDAFCAPSQFMLDTHTLAGFRAEHCHVIRNGLTISATGRQEAQDGPLRLLYLGQLERHKGILTVLDAMSQISGKADVTLDIAGRGSFEEDAARAAQTDGRITFHGFVREDEKERLLNSADVLLVPSLWHENAPVSIIEAYAHGLAVIATRMGGLPEMVEDEVTGLLVAPGDAQSLMEAVTSLCEKQADLAQMRQESLARSGYYSTARMADEYMHVYESLLGGA